MTDKHRILTADGKPVNSEDEFSTKRIQERAKEDQEYLPVIIKRTDQVVKHPGDTLEQAIREGLEQIKRPIISLALSSIAAGLILGFVPMLVGFASELTAGSTNAFQQRLSMALLYPIGFIVCIVSGTQLFTEHTATAIYPIVDRKARVAQLFKLWAIVLFGNLVGTFITSCFLILAEPVIQIGQGYQAVAHHLLHFSSQEVLVSAVLAGWLMAQGAWLIMASTASSSQILCIYIVTFTIGLGGPHHSIAGSAEAFVAYLSSPDVGLASVFNFILWAVIGNAIGGSVFVGLLNYGHIKQTQTLD